LQLKDPKEARRKIGDTDKKLEAALKPVKDVELMEAIRDLGGHDFLSLYQAMQAAKKNTRVPTMIVAHTIKGWGLEMAATPGNHSAIPSEVEINELQKKQGLKPDELFARFAENSKPGQALKKRGEQLYQDILAQEELRQRNKDFFNRQLEELGEMPDSLDINLKMASYPHTQWMLGQLTAKLTRIANTSLEESKLDKKQKPLNAEERAFKQAGEVLVSMAPDVGTSTNLNPAMDGKIYGSEVAEDIETKYGVKDKKTPDLIAGEDNSDRFLRFEIVEANVTSCMGAFGRLRDLLGIPILPLMTVYDFFVKRALDQYFYNQYWKSSFILVGTPAGVTLSPEGAQHGWKSDFQIPNQITWEPFFCQELDWILVDAIKRHLTYNNEGRSGVHIRGVTRGIEQKDMMKWLRRQRRFKSGLTENQLLCMPSYVLEGALSEDEVEVISESEILNTIKEEVLQGAYPLIDYQGYAGYEPGDNVVHIFAMGSLGTEAIKASEALLEKGIYANVFIVTSSDLLVGDLAYKDNYQYLKQGLRINSQIYLQPTLNGALQSSEVLTLAGRRVPIVSVHDGEPGLLDNMGSIVGVKHRSLAVRKHSKCGRPADIYKFHGIDADSVVEACGQVLAETALEGIAISPRVLNEPMTPKIQNWRELWPEKIPRDEH
ncbi:MAG: pyruvate dehydrogenase, partial [Bdellovibrionales bacterium]|nr:pyruvate dehydrogenase [Bdellovibrionales bacterium]